MPSPRVSVSAVAVLGTVALARCAGDRPRPTCGIAQLVGPAMVQQRMTSVAYVLSAAPRGLPASLPARVVGGGNYIRLSGTSASAPVITGVVAQLLQANPSLKPGQVKWLLTHTAQPITGPGTGAGYPQVGPAVNAGKIRGGRSGGLRRSPDRTKSGADPAQAAGGHVRAPAASAERAEKLKTRC